MSESVEIIIEAEDLASGKLRAVAQNADASVKRIKEVGGKAKAATEFAGTLSNLFGGSQIGAIAGQLAGLTEKTSQFAEVSKLGTAGALLFKAGIVAAAVGAGVAIGNFVGDAIVKLTGLDKKFREWGESAKKTAETMRMVLSKEFDFKSQEIELIQDPEAKRQAYTGLVKGLTSQMQGLQKQIEANAASVAEFDSSFEGKMGIGGGDKAANDALRTLLESQKEQVRVLDQQRMGVVLANNERQKAIDKAKEEIALQKGSDAFIAGLEQEVSLLRLKKELVNETIAMRATVDGGAADRATALLNERDALLALREQEKAAEDEQKKTEADKLATANRIAATKDAELDRLKQERILLEQGEEAAKRFALAKQGIADEDINIIIKEERSIQNLRNKKKEEDENKAAEDAQREADRQLKIRQNEKPPELQATQSRLLTRGGGAQSGTEKLLRESNERQKRQLALQERQTKAAEKSAGGVKLEVVN